MTKHGIDTRCDTTNLTETVKGYLVICCVGSFYIFIYTMERDKYWLVENIVDDIFRHAKSLAKYAVVFAL